MWLCWGEDLEGGACSHNLYTFGPRPRRIVSVKGVRGYVTTDCGAVRTHRAQSPTDGGPTALGEGWGGCFWKGCGQGLRLFVGCALLG